MKLTKKKLKNAGDPLLESLIKQLRKSGTICGTGAEMNELRKQKKS